MVFIKLRTTQKHLVNEGGRSNFDIVCLSFKNYVTLFSHDVKNTVVAVCFHRRSGSRV